MHKAHVPQWAVERGRYLNSFDAIDPSRAALVVIDMQSVFLAPDQVFGNPCAMGIIPAVNRLAAAMRKSGGRVIWTRQTVDDQPPLAMAAWQYDPADPTVRRAMEAMLPGTVGHDLHPEMQADPQDLVINKYRYSAFACPAGNLEAVLQRHGVDTLLIAGTLTNVCCESTGRDAYMRGYKVILLSDATAAVTDAEQDAALLSMRLHFADVKDSAAVISMLEQKEEQPR